MKKDKILLINPEETRSKFQFNGIIDDEPYDLEIIYTVMKKKKIPCMIYDAVVDNQDINDLINDFKPTYVYLNGVVKQVPIILDYVSKIKSINDSIKIIIGGIFAEYNYKELFNNNIDFITRSYDPLVIYEIINTKKDYKNINGLCYKNNNQWVINSLKYFDINNLTRTDRTYFYENIDKYRYLELMQIARIRTSYACPYKCEFCYRTMLNTGKYVSRDIEDVVEEIKELKINNIYFIDDDFLFNKKRLLKFIDLVKKNNIKKNYVAYGRADFIVNNKDIIKQLKEIGFYYLLVGLESIDDEYLTDYNKKTIKNQNVECVNFLNEIGINCMGMFILDNNFEKRDFNNLYKWIKNNKLKHVALSMLTPLPGTKFYEENKDKLITYDYSKFDYIHLVLKPSKMSIKMYYIHYYILLLKLFKMANKNKIYGFIDWKEQRKNFFSLIFKNGK